MKNVLKWGLSTLLGLVFLWLMFWAYMIFLQVGMAVVLLVLPFILVLMPVITLYRKVIKKEEVSNGDWIFSFVVCGAGIFIIYGCLLMILNGNF